jgi:hypothetical protein
MNDTQLTPKLPGLLVDWEGSSEFQQTPVPPRDGGYPFTVLAADGKLVTAYYSRGVPAHQCYHVGGGRWRPRDGAFPILPGPAK